MSDRPSTQVPWFAGAGCITVSFRPAIPRRVAPQQSPLPLRRHGHSTSPFTPGIANRLANLRLAFGTFYSPSTPGIANMPANLLPISVSHHRGAPHPCAGNCARRKQRLIIMSKIDIENLKTDESNAYPAPFRQAVAGRVRKRLGDVAGLTQFGVNLTTLKAGAASAQRHWHAAEDEFIYVVAGEVVLCEDSGETVLRAGDAAGFKAGVANATVSSIAAARTLCISKSARARFTSGRNIRTSICAWSATTRARAFCIVPASLGERETSVGARR
jgi:uncharacterized cupin superfamily protein